MLYGRNNNLLALSSSVAQFIGMIKVFFLFSITPDFAIAATATIDDGSIYGKVDLWPNAAGNVNTTVNITGLTGMWSY